MMELKKYKICPSCGEHNRPTSLECRKCETDLTGIRVVDSETEQSELEKNNDDTKSTSVDAGNDEIKLVRICEECGTENAPQARKCKQCGEEISDILPISTSKKEEYIFSYELKSIDGICTEKIDKPIVIVGREAELKEYLRDKLYVSRQHAELTVVAGKVFIKNISKTNKTFINDEELSNEEPYALTNGDEIGLGGKVIAGERQENAAYFLFQG